MSANELRQAAETLRVRANNIPNARSPLHWFDGDVDLQHAIASEFLGNADTAFDDAQWIALMSPAVGLALADWLDHSARQLGRLEPSDSHPGLIVARLINGGA